MSSTVNVKRPSLTLILMVTVILIAQNWILLMEINVVSMKIQLNASVIVHALKISYKNLMAHVSLMLKLYKRIDLLQQQTTVEPILKLFKQLLIMCPSTNVNASLDLTIFLKIKRAVLHHVILHLLKWLMAIKLVLLHCAKTTYVIATFMKDSIMIMEHAHSVQNLIYRKIKLASRKLFALKQN